MRLRLLTTTLVSAALAVLPAAALASTGTGGASAPASGTAAPAAAHHIHTTGVATWFGPGFYGQKTACGQTLTPAVVGVANRTLPCGTLVKVTYAGHALTVPVLDRGPYSHIADWDLTAGAAQALGVSDTVRIGTRIVGTTPNVPSLGLPAAPASTALAGGALAG
jgi:rare lipoprotein A (peptidoglycan hydrolase)